MHVDGLVGLNKQLSVTPGIRTSTGQLTVWVKHECPSVCSIVLCQVNMSICYVNRLNSVLPRVKLIGVFVKLID
jgi:hypothetical protein